MVCARGGGAGRLSDREFQIEREAMTNPVENNAPRSRSRFWMLVAVFFAPLLVAFVLYYAADWRPAGSTNHGDLIHPPRPLPTASLLTPQGTAIAPEVLQGQVDAGLRRRRPMRRALPRSTHAHAPDATRAER